MPEFLADPSLGFFIILGLMTLVAVGLYLRNPRRSALITVLLSLVILVSIILADQFFQSPREESQSAIEGMSRALNERNAEAFASYVSESFTYKSWKKKDLVENFNSLATKYNIRTAVWDFNRELYEKHSDTEITLQFNGKGENEQGQYPVHFHGRFIKDPDGKWRLSNIKIFDVINQKDPKSIPGVP